MTTTENARATVDQDIADVTETDGGSTSASRRGRLRGGVAVRAPGRDHGIAGALDVLADRLYDNASTTLNATISAFHAMKGHAGFTFLVTAWSVDPAGGSRCYPGRGM